MTSSLRRGRSKAVAAWLALIGGSLGWHRFYLHGGKDLLGWLHPWPTLAGAYGFWRMREHGVDDALGARLVPLLGAMLAVTMLQAIVYALTSDARWAERRPEAPAPASAWPSVIAAVVALAVGATVAMSTIVFVAQRYFESLG